MLPGFGQPLEWMPAYKDRFPVTITNEGLEWTARALLIRELCMLKVIEEITEKPDWSRNVRNAHTTTSWTKEILALDWSKHIKYADFTSSMAEQVRCMPPEFVFNDSSALIWCDATVYPRAEAQSRPI